MTYEPHNIDQLNHSKPTYLAAYGLTEAPFSLQLDDRFFYSNATLTERLELLKHYTQYGNLLLIVSGERGIGKSSIKQRFINTAQEEWQVCEIQAHTMMDASILLKQIAHGFNITEPPHEPAALFEVLSTQLEYMHQAAYVPILIIDDAHELPQDALQALLYLAEHHSNQQTTLRIILFCEPEIEIMLDDPAIHSLRDRVTHSMKIPTLDETQTAEYLRHRLAVAGLDGTSPFTPKLVHKIFQASEGIPAKINEYAHQNLLDDSEPLSTEEIDLDRELIQATTPFNLRNMLLGSFALAVIIAVLLFQDRINSLFEEPTTITIAETKIEPKQEPNKKAVKQDAIKIESTSTIQPPKEKTIEFNLNKELPLNKKTEEKITPAVKPTTDTSKDITTLTLITVNPSPVPVSKQRQIISISGTGFHKRQKVKVSWTGKEKILTETQVNVTSDSYMNLILNVGMQADTWTVTVSDSLLNLESNTISFNVVTPEKEKTPTKAAVTKLKLEPNKKLETILNNGLYGQNWIKLQNKNHFTLQLLGTHQKNALPTYLKKFALKNDAATFKTKRNSKDWFTLIYGSYATKSAAQAAAKQLSKKMSKPWVRSFASILPSLKNEPTIKNIADIIPTMTIPNNHDGWLWSQDPRHYTLQLTAGTDKKAIQTYIKRHHLKGKAVYFHRLRDGKDWYILVYGSYSGFSKAKQAIKQLPLAVQKAKPWARSFSAIHAELN